MIFIKYWKTLKNESMKRKAFETLLHKIVEEDIGYDDGGVDFIEYKVEFDKYSCVFLIHSYNFMEYADLMSTTINKETIFGIQSIKLTDKQKEIIDYILTYNSTFV